MVQCQWLLRPKQSSNNNNNKKSLMRHEPANQPTQPAEKLTNLIGRKWAKHSTINNNQNRIFESLKRCSHQPKKNNKNKTKNPMRKKEPTRNTNRPEKRTKTANQHILHNSLFHSSIFSDSVWYNIFHFQNRKTFHATIFGSSRSLVNHLPKQQTQKKNNQKNRKKSSS